MASFTLRITEAGKDEPIFEISFEPLTALIDFIGADDAVPYELTLDVLRMFEAPSFDTDFTGFGKGEEEPEYTAAEVARGAEKLVELLCAHGARWKQEPSWATRVRYEPAELCVLFNALRDEVRALPPETRLDSRVFD
jgi:hypothetical protein